ncbi:glycosyltransferase family 4 protein [Candidatus Pelagibacter sp.]|nr:glycosyltransferase family 4 protein [Candidatus Pelagibacter sp.]
MKVFHLITSIDNGGAENHLASLVKQQIKNYEVFVIYLRGNSYWKKKLESSGVKVIQLKLNKLINIINLLLIIYKVNKLVNIHKPEIVHSHLSSMELIGSLVKFFSKKKFKFIVTKHLDSFFLEASSGQNNLIQGLFLDYFIFKNADKIICISNQIKKYFLKKIKVPNRKLRVIYYGLNESDLNKKKKSRLKSIKLQDLKKKFVICCIARHVKQKSLDFLIKTFHQFKKIETKSKLILVGEGPETKKLKILAKKLDVYEDIIWINYAENVLQLLKLSKVFVLPSKYEGFGLVLLEAMYAKKPIIASRVSAIPEVIKNNWNGLLIKHNDIKDFNSKLLRIKNEKIAKRLIKNSQITLKKKFNLDKMVKLTNEIYKEATI